MSAHATLCPSAAAGTHPIASRPDACALCAVLWAHEADPYTRGRRPMAQPFRSLPEAHEFPPATPEARRCGSCGMRRSHGVHARVPSRTQCIPHARRTVYRASGTPWASRPRPSADLYMFSVSAPGRTAS